MKCCQRCVIKGRVQGVFYRQATLKKAKALGICGWVRNLPNGDVECVLCGEEKAVEEMGVWLKKGPPAAKVNSVEVESIAWEEYQDFVIQR